jgi:hypothetical protein
MLVKPVKACCPHASRPLVPCLMRAPDPPSNPPRSPPPKATLTRATGRGTRRRRTHPTPSRAHWTQRCGGDTHSQSTAWWRRSRSCAPERTCPGSPRVLPDLCLQAQAGLSCPPPPTLLTSPCSPTHAFSAAAPTNPLRPQESYQHIRALPCPAGAAVLFTHRIIHWGSRGRPGHPTPRISLSFGCADDAYEAPYFDR